MKQKSFFNKWINLIIVLTLIPLCPLVMGWIGDGNYNTFTSIFYAFFTISILICFILFFEIFLSISYSKEKGLRNKIINNSGQIFHIIIFYLFYVSMLSNFLLTSLKGFASIIDIPFYLERSIFILPAFVGFLILLTRVLSIEHSKIDRYYANLINRLDKSKRISKVNRYRINIMNSIKDIIIGTIILGILATLIYNVPVGISNTKFLTIPLVYGTLFGLLDVLFGIKFAKYKLRSPKEPNTDKKEKKEPFFKIPT